ncbi:MAG: galactokinase [Bacteroidetes bacterium]|nr:galactokinase [Bacteroidota bacterium]
MIVVRTPFRLPLGGGGTDLPSYYKKYEGLLVTAAINKYMYININLPAIVDKIKINYSKTEVVGLDEIDKIEHNIVRETLRYLKVRQPIEIHSMADLSGGTGMGSSSSYTVGLLKALNLMLRRYVPVQVLAEEACRIEIDLIGKPIGKQDQYAAAFGGIIQLEIDQLGNVAVTPLRLDHEIIYELENRLLMFYTDIERDANQILAEQSEKIAKGAMSAEKAEKAKKEKGDEGSAAIQAMHKIKEIGREAKVALEKGDVDQFGRLLNAHWMVKKGISDQMSSRDIDKWYDLAMANGALGGKIMGAGGGGFFLFCVGNGKRKHLRRTLEEAGLRYMDFRFDWEGSKELVNI